MMSRNNLTLLILYAVSSVYIIFNHLLFKYFSSIDEIVVVLLIVYGLANSYLLKSREAKYTFGILLCYLVYSLLLQVNKPIAAFYDFSIFLKPFVCFYVPCVASLRFKEKDRGVLKKLYLVLGIVLLIELPFIDHYYTNTSGYYHSCMICAFSYLFFSDFAKKDWIVTTLILTLGLFSIRAKFFTIYIIFIFVAFFLKERFKLQIKWAIVAAILLAIIIFVNEEKFNAYFLHGIENEMARTILYSYSWNVLVDYIPFGSGFGTYATEAAAKYYSPLYHQLGIDSFWGIRAIDYQTSADFLKDTFYPVLAQFGFVGIYLYILFWYKRWKEGLCLNFQKYKLFITLFVVELVQNIADNSFTGPDCVPIMMMMGFIMGEYNFEHKYFIKRRVLNLRAISSADVRG